VVVARRAVKAAGAAWAAVTTPSEEPGRVVFPSASYAAFWEAVVEQEVAEVELLQAAGLDVPTEKLEWLEEFRGYPDDIRAGRPERE
jgi:hypothetical protein